MLIINNHLILKYAILVVFTMTKGFCGDRFLIALSLYSFNKSKNFFIESSNAVINNEKIF